MSLPTILLVLLVIILLGGIGGPYLGVPYGYGLGHGGIGVIGIILIVVVILAIMGRL
jgi:hypothetical protein